MTSALARLASLIRDADDVVLSDAFDDPAIADAAARAHRHAFAAGDTDELARLLFAHRTARRIIVCARRCEGLEAPCTEAAAILIPFDHA